MPASRGGRRTAAGAAPARLDRRAGRRLAPRRSPDAAAVLPRSGRRVFLTTGPQACRASRALDAAGSWPARWIRPPRRCPAGSRCCSTAARSPSTVRGSCSPGTGSTCWSPRTAAARDGPEAHRGPRGRHPGPAGAPAAVAVRGGGRRHGGRRRRPGENWVIARYGRGWLVTVRYGGLWWSGEPCTPATGVSGGSAAG